MVDRENRPAATRIRIQARQTSNTIWIYLVLFLATFALYSQVRHFDFVDFDDPEYVGNPHVAGGVTWPGLVWAFTSGEEGNWFPVTRISHMLDAQFFGQQSGLRHLTNVFFHALSALFLFAFLHRSTGSRWRSLLVASLFALHPLHVESVAWVAERKDVLCAFFWFLTMWAYLRYAERPGWQRYVLVLAAFCLGLMSKPMIVTLPFVLLMLDVWPLRRLALKGVATGKTELKRISWRRAVGEKIPLVVLTAGAAAIAYLTQKSGGAIEMLSRPIGTRVENALVSYVLYAGKMFWPARLALLYPYPRHFPVWQAVASGLAVAAISGLVAIWYRSRPYLAAGWFWYLGTLIPVIGLVQIGAQAYADRYTYIPMVGLSIMLAWALGSVVERWPGAKTPVVAGVLVLGAATVAATGIQIQYWANSESLFRRTLDVTEDNYTIHYCLGLALSKIPGRSEDAVSEYRAALRAKPEYQEIRARIHTHLGWELSKNPGRLSDAISEYQAALEINPNFFEAHRNLADALLEVPDRLPDAIDEYRAALRIKPASPTAYHNLAAVHNNLAFALSKVPGRQSEVIAEYQAALRIDPELFETHVNLADALSEVPGRLRDAIGEYEAALRIRPSAGEALNKLATARAKLAGF